VNSDKVLVFSHPAKPFSEDELQNLITLFQDPGEDKTLTVYIIILFIERLNKLGRQEITAQCAPTDDQLIRFIFNDMKDDPFYELLAAKALKVAHYQMNQCVIKQLKNIKSDPEGVMRVIGKYMTSMVVARDIKEYDGKVPLKEFLQQRIEPVLRLFEGNAENPGD